MTPIELLESGPLHSFATWPNPSVPRISAGVYTIWQDNRFLYVGMAGRSLTAEEITQRRAGPNPKPTGLYDRLRSHRSGRRSGDQFCVYVADRLVLPRLKPDEMAAIANGELAMDHLVREYIQERLGYRFVETRDGQEARELERQAKGGALSVGVPVLNPG